MGRNFYQTILMNKIKFKLFTLLILIVSGMSCGDRNISSPDDNNGIALFNLSVTSSGLEVLLSWDAIDDADLLGYRIYRSTGGGGFIVNDSVDGSETAFSDSRVTADVNYEYHITAELTGDRESEPSNSVRIIPGLTTTWVLDNSTRILSELTHDAAHKTGKFFDDLPFVSSFDIDEKNGYIYLMNRFDGTLMLYVEGQLPARLTNSDSSFTLFDNPLDIDYDSFRDEMWIADGNSGNIYHFTNPEPGQWIREDSLNTGGSADEGQIDTNNGDYWVVNTIGKSVEIYQNRITGYSRKSIGGFTSGGIILALDDDRARAYAVDRGTGTVSVITATGDESNISEINQAFSGAVEPESGDLWLLADDDEDGIYELIKLSVTGGRIYEISTEFSKPTWLGVNKENMNVVVLNVAVDEPRVATFDKLGNKINTFDSLTLPERARIASIN